MDSSAKRASRKPVNVAASCLLTLALSGTGGLARAQAGSLPQGFSIPKTRDASELYQRARTHLAAERFDEAIVLLQDLLTRYGAQVLDPLEFEAQGAAAAPDEETADSGNAAGARQRLRPLGRRAMAASPQFQRSTKIGVAAAIAHEFERLPAKAQILYRERFGRAAQEAFEQALANLDRRLLVEVAVNYPLTQAALSARIALCDLEWESGQLQAARSALGDFTPEQLAAAGASESHVQAFEQRRQALKPLLEPQLSPSLAASESGVVPNAGLGGDAKALAQGEHTWSLRIDDGGDSSPFNVARGGDTHNLLPVVHKDTVYVCNSMNVRAIDLGTGRELWKSAEAPGWDLVDRGQVTAPNQRTGIQRPLRRLEFFEAIDRRNALIAPATDGRVVVAPLQVPLTQVGSQNFQSLRITYVIPDRRLFAFDARTGAPLWNHLPPLLADSENLPLERVARVAAPPVLAGSRLLVPLYRIQGRVDYHVACFDLASGERLWSTPVVSGQLPLNMFNQHSREFCSAPLVVEGQRVLAQTQLGVLAALDLFSGDILWELPIDPIPIPRMGHDWVAPEREQHWRNATPIVQGSVAVFAPLDCYDMIGVELETGKPLWIAPRAMFLPEGKRFLETPLRLFGASAERLYVAGPAIAAARAANGLREVPRADPLRGMSEELAPEGFFDPSYLAWPSLLARHVVVPGPEALLVLDAQDLKRSVAGLGGTWPSGSGAGNMLVAPDWSLVLSNKYLWANVDWQARMERLQAQVREHPLDPSRRLALAGMYLQRADLKLRLGILREAVDLAQQAQQTLVSPAGWEREPAPDALVAGEVRALSYRAAMLLARAHCELADTALGLEHAERALHLAHDALEKASAVVLALEIGRLRGGCRELTALIALLRELPTDLSLAAIARQSTGEGTRPLDSSLELTTLAEWTRDLAFDCAKSNQDVALEFELLDQALESSPDQALGAALGVYLGASSSPDPADLPARPGRRLAADHLAELLARDERARDLFVPFQARAQAALEQALAAGDPALLERLSSRYPHTDADLRAQSLRLERALESGSLAEVAQLVQRVLPTDLRWKQVSALAGSSHWLALDALERSARRSSNTALADRLRARMSRRHSETKEFPSDGSLPGPWTLTGPNVVLGPSLETSAMLDNTERLLWVVDEDPDPSAPIEDSAASEIHDPGHRKSLATSIWISSTNQGNSAVLTATGPDGPKAGEPPRWRENLGSFAEVWGAFRHADSLILFGPTQVAAVNLFDGRRLWARAAGRYGHYSKAHYQSGVLILRTQSESGQDEMLALDAVAGIELWRRNVHARTDSHLLVGPEHALLLANDGSRCTIEAIDLFCGRLSSTIELERSLSEADLAGAWIAETTAYLPRFPRASTAKDREQAVLTALDLDSGESSFEVPGDPRRELDLVFVCPQGLFLLFQPAGGPDTPRDGASPHGLFMEVNSRSGRTRNLNQISVAPLDVAFGPSMRSVFFAREPFLFLRSEPAAGEDVMLRMIHLPFGERWRTRLETPSEADPSPMIDAWVASAQTVALCRRPLPGESQGDALELALLDRGTGRLLYRRQLVEFQSPKDALRLQAMGRLLVVTDGRESLVLRSP